MSEWTAGATDFSLDLEAGRLTVSGELDMHAERDFQRAAENLLDSDARKLLIDLGDVPFICSTCLGTLFLIDERAKVRHMAVKIRLNRKIAPICRMMGLDELLDIEIV